MINIRIEFTDRDSILIDNVTEFYTDFNMYKSLLCVASRSHKDSVDDTFETFELEKVLKIELRK